VFASFPNSGSPIIEIEVFGWDNQRRRTVTGILDTGFTGFLMLPITTAFPIGLVLHSLSEVTLADGCTQNKIVCRGGIHFEGESQPGIILIEEQGTEALIGMEFLKAFNLILTLDATNSTLRLERAKE